MEIEIIRIIFLTVVLFSIGILGVLTRRNIIVMIMSVEIMLNSVNLLFIAFSRYFQDLNGEVMVLFVMAIAAAEAAVGLAIVIALHRNYHSIDTMDIKALKE